MVFKVIFKLFWEYQKNNPDTKYTIDDFTQSQAHGLFWDSEIREKVFELPKCKNDTKRSIFLLLSANGY